ncbi:response regulator transcription factor [Nostoc muscorum FACHB-395]|nr:response regulator transcription factor [Desmonostoc muscorum FACHB-395]
MLKIVIIEREPFTLLGIKTAISQSTDIEVSASATCGEIGLKLVQETKPDVVLVDFLLPDMSVLDLTRLIKNKGYRKRSLRQKDNGKSQIRNRAIYFELTAAVPTPKSKMAAPINKRKLGNSLKNA